MYEGRGLVCRRVAMCGALCLDFQGCKIMVPIEWSDVSTWCFVSFQREKCLGERKIHTIRRNFEQWKEKRRPLHFP